MFEEMLRQLESWAREQDLIQKAMESCRISLRNTAADDVEIGLSASADHLNGTPLSGFRLEFRKHSLTFQSALLAYPYNVPTDHDAGRGNRR